jgi:hypothetical protein
MGSEREMGFPRFRRFGELQAIGRGPHGKSMDFGFVSGYVCRGNGLHAPLRSAVWR